MTSDYVEKKQLDDLVVVAADLGFAKKGRNWAEKLDVPLAFVEKRRVDNEEQPEALALIGNVEGKNVVLVDDEVNTAGSVVNAVDVLRRNGARDIYLAFTHPFLTEKAYGRLEALRLKEIILTNTIPLPPEKVLPNMKILSVASLLGEVILRAHEGRSVGEMFDE
jgi:ribose-phosphate pyrophosphokinase